MKTYKICIDNQCKNYARVNETTVNEYFESLAWIGQ